MKTLPYLFLLALGSPALAADLVYVGNAMDEVVRVYWTAAGCAGVVDGKTFVCDSKTLAPGSQASYTFKGGTTLRRVAVAGPKDCEGKKAVDVGVSVVAGKGCTLSVVPDSPAVFANYRSESIRLKWTAWGCAGVSDGATTVCRAVTLAPGESDSYRFPPLTSFHASRWVSAKCPTTATQRIGIGGHFTNTNDMFFVNDSTPCGDDHQ